MDSVDREGRSKHEKSVNTAVNTEVNALNTLNAGTLTKPLNKVEGNLVVNERHVLDAAFAELQSIEQDMGSQNSKAKKVEVEASTTASEKSAGDAAEVDMSIITEGDGNNFSDAEESDGTSVAVVNSGENEGLIMNMDNKHIETRALFSPTDRAVGSSGPSQIRSPLMNTQNTRRASASSSPSGLGLSASSPIDNLKKRKISECSPYKIPKRQGVVGLDDLINKLDNMIIASEKRQCEKMESLLTERQENLLKEVKVENAKVLKKMKEESAKTVKAVESLKNTVEDQEKKIQK